ncbi:NAD-dependent protein deacylase [Clostridiisalibacter paucivorans]|uniref:NAD-dependent protein deacylase n=1 Tax=Clostridiisalibacter paucivorans TaxID=408753 RepID=UPI00047D57D1|nr:NAD-dependent protein deacylase [Clostridiisalibacter paucivorans]
MDRIKILREFVNSSDNIVFLGGAGVSTESNIPDFRSSNGIYSTESKYGYSPEVMLSHSFFVNHTEEFFDFYRNTMIYKDAKPNLAHTALAELEDMGKLKAIVTQNIDGLHQLAGSKNVIELHGSVYRNYCQDCRKFFDLDYVLNSKSMIPKCDQCGGIVKPDVVLYEEPLKSDDITMAMEAITNCDMLIVGGTSLVVYPAANLVRYYEGDKLVLINKDSTNYDRYAKLVINDSIGKTLNNIF